MPTLQEIGETLEKLLGKYEWTPRKPFVITALDTRNFSIYRFEISKTENAIRILEIWDKHLLHAHYFLLKTGSRWELSGQDREKLLMQAYEKIRIAIGPVMGK